jgi:hypothetical protein
VSQLIGHTGTVSCLATLGETRLVSGSYNGSLRYHPLSVWCTALVLSVDGGRSCVQLLGRDFWVVLPRGSRPRTRGHGGMFDQRLFPAEREHGWDDEAVEVRHRGERR